MDIPRRTSVALDEESSKILMELAEDGSKSNVVRKALKFYYDFRELEKKDLERLKTYWEMLQSGEHVILDLDHLLILLRIAESNEKASLEWDESHRRIALNHAEQFKQMSLKQILNRLETCNFFRYFPTPEAHILIFGNQEIKRFMKVFLEEILKKLYKKFEIKEEISKLRIIVLD